MKGYTALPKKQFFLLLGPLAILIFIFSIEVLMKGKDTVLFDLWVQKTNQVSNKDNIQALFSIYITGQLSMYFQKIIIPIGLSIHSYLAYTKLRINQLFVFIWTILSGGSFAYSLVGLTLNNPFVYIYIVLYGIILITLLSLLDEIIHHELA